MKSSLKRSLFSLAITCLLVQVSSGQQQPNKKVKNFGVNFSTFNHNTDISSGIWLASNEDNLICLHLTDGVNRKNPSFSINFCVPQSELKQNVADGNFELVRESGTMVFKGGTLNSRSGGDFIFKRNKGFESFLNKEGIRTDDENSYNYFKLFLSDVTQDYVLGLKNEAYDPTLKELGKLGIHQVGLDYIRALGKTNYKGLALEMLIKFAIHDVSISYINDLKAAGYGNIDGGMVKKFAIHNVSIDYIDGLSELGYGNLEPNMLKNFAIHDIRLDYIKDLADAGYSNLEPGTLKNFAVHAIKPNYIKSLMQTGIEKPEANTIKKAKIHNLRAGDIERAMAKGHNSNDLSDYIKLKIRGK